MGNKQGGAGGKKLSKQASTSDSAPKASQNSSNYDQLKGRGASQLLDDDGTRRQLKQFAQSKSSEKPELVAQVELLEAINKRRAVYTSGRRCGDEKEVCDERAEESGNAIVEKFIQDGAAKAVTLPDDLKTKILGLGDDMKEVGTFDDVKAWLETQIDAVLKTL
eukprot:TRINITY_DN14446_c0_g1_i1.p1 TRINITY_DN14446_c0_g1~~TRINITY_DN14446_c0_g1_i1.p1  ORF type:complete len:164 (-),score=40.39 TRINITY_DN14446_c0_g1_i1:21-512(-)